MVSGCNIQISLCCNTALLCVWITDCNRRPVLSWLKVTASPAIRRGEVQNSHSQFMSHSLCCLLLYGVTVPVHNGQKTFYQIRLGLSVFHCAFQGHCRQEAQRRMDYGSPLPTDFLHFRDPSKKRMCCGGKDWSTKQVVKVADPPHPFLTSF